MNAEGTVWGKTDTSNVNLDFDELEVRLDLHCFLLAWMRCIVTHPWCHHVGTLTNLYCCVAKIVNLSLRRLALSPALALTACACFQALFTILENDALRKLVKNKGDTVHLVDNRRSHNICIELSGIRMPFADIKKALTNMDAGGLTVRPLYTQPSHAYLHACAIPHLTKSTVVICISACDKVTKYQIMARNMSLLLLHHFLMAERMGSLLSEIYVIGTMCI